ncbi:MAG: helix-turn-helix domain-containing protein [Pirellulaceae bacterium]
MSNVKPITSPPPNQRRYLGVRDVASQLGTGVNQVLAHIKAGTLAAIDMRKPGVGRPFYRISRDDLARFEATHSAARAPAPVAPRRKRMDIPKHIGV